MPRHTKIIEAQCLCFTTKQRRRLLLEMEEDGSDERSWWELRMSRLAAWGVDILDALSETNEDLDSDTSRKVKPSS